MYPKLFALLIFSAIQLSINAQTIPSYLPTDGLVGWWPFTGNAIDSSSHGNDGFVSGATLTTDRFGNANSAYLFNGVDSRIEVQDAVTLRCRKVTLSAWVFNNNISKIGQIIYKGSVLADGEAYSISSVNKFFATAAKVGSQCQANVGWLGGSGKELAVQGVWEHFISVYDGSTFKIYKNGTLDTSMIVSGLIDSCFGNLRFGYNHTRYSTSTGDAFNGIIDDIGIWNRALSETEISQIYSRIVVDPCGDGNLGINICQPQRSLHVKDVIRLEPRSTSPTNPGKGDIYFDGTTNKLRVYDGTDWKDCW